VNLSIIVPVGSRHSDIVELYADYKRGADATGRSYELIFVLDGPHRDVSAGLAKLRERGEKFVVVSLTRSSGEATALMVGFEHARGEVILTLPAYFQIEPVGIAALVDALDKCDVAVARRWPRAGGALERLRRGAFHSFLARVTGLKVRDLGCGARAMKRAVLEEITLYGDQHRFLPLLAFRQGFRVSEIDVPQSPRDRFEDGYRIREYAHRFLDIFTVFFLVRFTKKPLRFFGMLGVSTFIIGAVLVTWMVIERFFFEVGLANRPALLLSSLLVVLGLQLFAIGLLGELIIFTHAKGLKDYQVEEIVEFPDAPTPAPPPIEKSSSRPVDLVRVE
jgi:glycosyltransferase involved in cell wall biosynthesis